MSKPIVVVTGASGFVATHVIKVLQDKGYPTRGTVRSISDPTKTDPLKAIFPQLELFAADLLTPGSFDEVMKGAHYVIHTASPFPSGEPKDPQKELVDPALNGTLNVLHSALKSGTVKKVVLTSSIAAVAGKRPEGHVYTEEDWNLDSTLTFESYRYSKRVAEEAAWNFVKEHNNAFDLAVICPSFVVGPPLYSRADATSIQKVRKFFVEGKADNTCFGCVDVRDVAKAHVAAMEKENAKSRYMVTTPEAVPNSELLKMIMQSGKFKEYEGQFPNPAEYKIPSYRLKYSREKAEKELGISFTPIENAVVDAAQAMIQLGIIPKK